jgi:hypothetical protein
MNELRDRLQELADGYARTAASPGPDAARRRGRRRRRRAAAAVVLAGLLAAAGSVGLLPALRAPRPAEPVEPGPTPAQVPRSTAWFQPTYPPGGFRRSARASSRCCDSGLPSRMRSRFAW